MSAVTLFELEQAGIIATATAGKLRLSAPPGRLTADLRERIASHRDDLLHELAALDALRGRLLKLADAEGLPLVLVHGLPDADVLACVDYPDNELRGLLRALGARERMDAGMVPLEWGEPVARTCEGCGPVLLWATCPDVVLACPWCFRRKAGKPIPRPLVACGRCRHYLPNPEAGMGGCVLGTGRAYGPMKRHRCTDWRNA